MAPPPNSINKNTINKITADKNGGFGILVAGSGGQGVLFSGKLLAHAAMLSGKNVTWFPSYGAEMRGGTANCTVVISDGFIGSPIVRNPDVLMVLNAASMLRFHGRVKKKGLLLMDSSLINGPDPRGNIVLLKVPASDIAMGLGNQLSANMVLVGALSAATGLFDPKTVFKALHELTPPSREKRLHLNMEAVKSGMACVK